MEHAKLMKELGLDFMIESDGTGAAPAGEQAGTSEVAESLVQECVNAVLAVLDESDLDMPRAEFTTKLAEKIKRLLGIAEGDDRDRVRAVLGLVSEALNESEIRSLNEKIASGTMRKIFKLKGRKLKVVRQKLAPRSERLKRARKNRTRRGRLKIKRMKRERKPKYARQERRRKGAEMKSAQFKAAQESVPDSRMLGGKAESVYDRIRGLINESGGSAVETGDEMVLALESVNAMVNAAIIMADFFEEHGTKEDAQLAEALTDMAEALDSLDGDLAESGNIDANLDRLGALAQALGEAVAVYERYEIDFTESDDEDEDEDDWDYDDDEDEDDDEE